MSQEGESSEQTFSVSGIGLKSWPKITPDFKRANPDVPIPRRGLSNQSMAILPYVIVASGFN